MTDTYLHILHNGLGPGHGAGGSLALVLLTDTQLEADWSWVGEVYIDVGRRSCRLPIPHPPFL